MTRSTTFQIQGVPALTIRIPSGTADVRTGASDRVEVALDGRDADDWEITRLGNVVAVEPGPRLRRRARSMRVLVEVPPGTDIDVKSATADVTLTGVLGSVRVKSASGDVRLGSAGKIDVDTASGDASAADVDSTASCRTGSGDVDLGRVGGRLTVSTASGDVRVAGASEDVVISSASGDVRVDRFDGAAINVKSMSGDVTIGLPRGIRVDPDLATLSGHTRLPPVAAPEVGVDRRVVRVGLRTVSGDITIHRLD